MNKINLNTIGNIVILICLIFLVFRTCKRDIDPTVIEHNKVIRNDTTRIHYVVTDTTYKHITKHITQRYFYSDTSYLDAVTKDSVNQYTLSHQDSTIKITHSLSTFGKLKDFSFDYDLKIPTINTRTVDTVRISNTLIDHKTMTKTEYKLRHGFFVGADVGYGIRNPTNGWSNSGTVTPSVLYQGRNGIIWGAGYELMQGTIEGKLYVPLFTFKSKK